MTTVIETRLSAEHIAALPEFEGISRRFFDDFQAFVQCKKLTAVKSVLKQELKDTALASSDNLIQAIVERVEDEALLEKRYIFLSVNPQCLV